MQRKFKTFHIDMVNGLFDFAMQKICDFMIKSFIILNICGDVIAEMDN